MRRPAPVYRHLEARQRVLGLEVPFELVLFLAGFYPAAWFLPPGLGFLSLSALYVALRLASYGRPPLFWPHLLQFKLRRLVSGGYLSPAARAPQPLFPWGRLDFRLGRPLPRGATARPPAANVCTPPVEERPRRSGLVRLRRLVAHFSPRVTPVRRSKEHSRRG